MADVTRSTTAGIDTVSARFAPAFKGFLDEDVPAAAPCRIDPATGGVKMCNGGATGTTEFAGISPRAGKQGQPITLFGVGTIFGFSGSKGNGALVAGNRYFVSATAGEIDDTATAGDADGKFRAINSHELMVISF